MLHSLTHSLCHEPATKLYCLAFFVVSLISMMWHPVPPLTPSSTSFILFIGFLIRLSTGRANHIHLKLPPLIVSFVCLLHNTTQPVCVYVCTYTHTHNTTSIPKGSSFQVTNNFQALQLSNQSHYFNSNSNSFYNILFSGCCNCITVIRQPFLIIGCHK